MQHEGGASAWYPSSGREPCRARGVGGKDVPCQRALPSALLGFDVPEDLGLVPKLNAKHRCDTVGLLRGTAESSRGQA